MKYSPLNNIPISLGQRTPDVLRQSNRIRGNDVRGDYSLRQDTSTISHRPYISSASYNDRSAFVDQEPSRVYGKSLLQESRTSFQDPYSQQKIYSARRPEESYSSLNRSYQPMASSQPMGSSYISRAYETYVARPQELVHIVMSSYIVNSGILLLTSFAFLLLCLNFLSLVHHGWHYSLDTWQFLRALLFLGAILVSKALMLKYYDTFINWNDVVRDLFRGPLFLITLVFSLIAIIAYTYDMFTFLILGKTYEEFSHVLIICIVNSIALVVKSLSHKEYLLSSSSFETNLSYLSEYRLRNLFNIGYAQVSHSIKIVLISALLCYSGLISLIFEETLSMLSYEYLQFPGLWKALMNALVYFVGLFYANFILEVQIKLMKRIWIRVLSDIGSMRYAMKSLYYFNDRTESDDALVGHCLRFLDTKLRYECRNSLLRRQNPGDPESKTIWHVLVETTLEKMDRINNQLQSLKASRLVMSGSFGPKGHHENLLMALEYFFTSPPDVRDVRALYHDLCLAAHQFKVINRVFREMKVLNLDVALRNFNINLQTYYQGLYNIYNILYQIKNINQSTYVDSLLTDISHFEEVIKEGLLMLNKFVALQ